MTPNDSKKFPPRVWISDTEFRLVSGGSAPDASLLEFSGAKEYISRIEHEALMAEEKNAAYHRGFVHGDVIKYERRGFDLAVEALGKELITEIEYVMAHKFLEENRTRILNNAKG